MKQKMEVEYEKTIKCRVPSGERYTCDGCGCIIVDTTKIDETMINKQRDEGCFKIYYELDNEETEMYACDHKCVTKIFNKWMSEYEAKGFPPHSSFDVNTSYIPIGHLMRRYSANMSIEEWNEIKKNSVPIER